MIMLLNEQDIDLRPTKIVAAARNYVEHAAEMKAEPPKEPKFFLKPPSALLATNGEVVLPKVSVRVDHEVELAVIMKEETRKVRPGDVKERILGYTILVDVTARDIQKDAKKDGMPWTIAKGFDTFAPTGPRIVPASELDPGNLDIWLQVNGVYKQRGNTKHMIFPVEELISFISCVMTLEPMDVIATGTPSGVGPMNDGDMVEAGITGIGILKFKAVRER